MTLRLCSPLDTLASEASVESGWDLEPTEAETDGSDVSTASSRESLHYLTEMTEGLRDMALRSGFRRLHLILGMAHHQAIEEEALLSRKHPGSVR